MASCQTARWVASAPYVRLTVTETSTAGKTSPLSWKLEYYSDAGASTSYQKEYSVTIAGNVVKSGTYDINGKTGWHTIASGTQSVTRTTSAQTIAFSLSFRFGLNWSGVFGGTKTASGSVSVAAEETYTIAYNANGGSGAPSSQTKRIDVAITLSKTKPTRTGYTFQGWATSASGSVAYASGANYTANKTITLYAVWKINTYTIAFNAAGGTGGPTSQTKSYNVALTISSSIPTREDYIFLGWATYPSSTTVVYTPGSSYTNNAAITLYAVWKVAYISPIVYNLIADRCDYTGAKSDEGLFGSIHFEWECTNDVTSITIEWASLSYGNGSTTVSATGKSGIVDVIVGDSMSVPDPSYTVLGNCAFDTDASYTVTVTVSDSRDSSNFTTTLAGCIYPLDVKAGGKGIAFGKPAELNDSDSLGGMGVADFAFDVKFNEPVYGNVLGLNKLPRIPANSDFNDYKTTGAWGVYKTADAATIANIPCPYAGRLEVNASTGEGILLEGWSYLRQRYIPYNEENATWERHLKRTDENVWTYTDWWRSSLTPAAAKKTYHEPKVLWVGAFYMQASHTIKLSEGIHEQPTGVVLVFTQYSASTGAAAPDYMHSFFIPKTLINTQSDLPGPGKGYHFEMAYSKYSCVCGKHLYIGYDEIAGSDTNVAVGTDSTTGITYNNKGFVLRYVIGV